MRHKKKKKTENCLPFLCWKKQKTKLETQNFKTFIVKAMLRAICSLLKQQRSTTDKSRLHQTSDLSQQKVPTNASTEWVQQKHLLTGFSLHTEPEMSVRTPAAWQVLEDEQLEKNGRLSPKWESIHLHSLLASGTLCHELPGAAGVDVEKRRRSQMANIRALATKIWLLGTEVVHSCLKVPINSKRSVRLSWDKFLKTKQTELLKTARVACSLALLQIIAVTFA